MKYSAPVFRIASAALFAAALPLIVHADAIDTNRPGFSFSPNVVGESVWQLETGLSYDRSDTGLKTWSVPNAELRYGIGNDVELFVSNITWNDAEFGFSSASGFGDVSVGTKIAISNNNADTRMALLFLVSMPTGKDEFSSDSWDPSLGFVWSHSGKLPLAGTFKATEIDGDWMFDNGLKLPVQLNDRQSVFVEWEANIPEEGSTTHWLNSGFQWLLSGETQVDFAIDLSLSDFGDDYSLGVGFSHRF